MFLEIKTGGGALNSGDIPGDRKCLRKSHPFNAGERGKVCRDVLFKLTEVSAPRMDDFKKRNSVVWSKRYGSK